MVTVYSKNNCIQCKMTKKFLTDNQVHFNEVNVEDNPEVLAELKAQGYRQMPIVKAPGMEVFSGFRPDVLKQILA